MKIKIIIFKEFIAVDKKEVDALLQEIQDKISLDKKLGTNPKDKYKSDDEREADPIYQQIRDEIKLDKSLAEVEQKVFEKNWRP